MFNNIEICAIAVNMRFLHFMQEIALRILRDKSEIRTQVKFAVLFCGRSVFKSLDYFSGFLVPQGLGNKKFRSFTVLQRFASRMISSEIHEYPVLEAL